MSARKSSPHESGERPEHLDFVAADSHIVVTSRTPPNLSDWSSHAKKGGKKRLKEALAACDQAIQQNSHHAAAYTANGDLLRALQRFEEALAAYDRALSLDPDNAEAQSGRGLALERLGRIAEAQRAYQLAREIGARRIARRMQGDESAQAKEG